MSVKEVNVQTGKFISRPYTQKELDDIAIVEEKERPARELRDALEAKKATDIDALGTRASLLQEIDTLVGISPQAKALLKKLAEIVYSNEKGTID